VDRVDDTIQSTGKPEEKRYMKAVTWIVGCLLFFLVGVLLGIYLDELYKPNHIVFQAQASTKLNLVPSAGDVIEWKTSSGGQLPVTFEVGTSFLPCNEGNGVSTCTLRDPPAKDAGMSYTYTCADNACFDPTLAPVSPKGSGGGTTPLKVFIHTLDRKFSGDESRPTLKGKAPPSPEGGPVAASSGMPREISLTCDGANLVFYEGGDKMTKIFANPQDIVQFTGISAYTILPLANPVLNGQNLCSSGDLSSGKACGVATKAPGTYPFTVKSSVCGGGDLSTSMTVPIPQ
jgi:hypothetical protein